MFRLVIRHLVTKDIESPNMPDLKLERNHAEIAGNFVHKSKYARYCDFSI